MRTPDDGSDIAGLLQGAASDETLNHPVLTM
jgi:hypothetical protein